MLPHDCRQYREFYLYASLWSCDSGSGFDWSSLGKGDILTVRRVAFLSSAYGVAIMFLLGTILFFGAPSFALLFTKDLEAVRQVVTALRIDASTSQALRFL